MNKLNLFKNSEVNEADFLENYWHKKPLLIRAAVNINDLSVLPNKLQLQQLSCHEDIQSRIVFKNSENNYEVEYGPFLENDFEEIVDNCWNLLVSDIDKWQPISRNILKYFNFIRNWIFDDIMVSCGSKNGTVGPHTDHYDVFLLQVHGQRQWAYTYDKIFNPELMTEQSLKLMSQFNADETQVLNPGDVLYLPPEVGHYGIAMNDECVTSSIGIRTPSHSELITAFVDNISQNLSANDRFEEPSFSKQPKLGRITEQDISQVLEILHSKLKIEPQHLGLWFGEYITEYRSLFYEFNQHQDIESLNFEKDLVLSPFSKSCYYQNKDNISMFINGKSYQTSLLLAETICNHKIIAAPLNKGFTEADMTIIIKLFENGSLIQNK